VTESVTESESESESESEDLSTHAYAVIRVHRGSITHTYVRISRCACIHILHYTYIHTYIHIFAVTCVYADSKTEFCCPKSN
jgi:hypothetical protein